MTVVTIYTEAGTGTYGCDGWAGRTLKTELWAALRGNTGTVASVSASPTGWCNLRARSSSGYWEQMYRSFFIFNTNGIPAGATVTDAVLGLYGSSRGNALAGVVGDIVSTTPASNTNLVAADYNVANFGTTVWGSVAFADYALNTYNRITLNPACIVPAGITRLGGRLHWDAINSPPTWVSGLQGFLGCYMADSGQATAPYLEVTYTYGAGTVITPQYMHQQRQRQAA